MRLRYKKAISFAVDRIVAILGKDEVIRHRLLSLEHNELQNLKDELEMVITEELEES